MVSWHLLWVWLCSSHSSSSLEPYFPSCKLPPTCQRSWAPFLKPPLPCHSLLSSPSYSRFLGLWAFSQSQPLVCDYSDSSLFGPNLALPHFHQLPLLPHLVADQQSQGMNSRASHVQLFWIFMLFQAVNTVKLNFKAGLFSSTFQFEHSFLAKSQC